MSAKSRMLKRFKRKPPVFLLFADLDGTFTPMDIAGKIDFIEVSCSSDYFCILNGFSFFMHDS